MRPIPLHLWLRTIALGLMAWPAVALAVDVPGINGHMTDPRGKLSGEAKTQVEADLTKIQEDTHIDVAGWLSDASPEQAEEFGNEAFHRWNIGKDWDNGVFFLFPATGKVHIIQDHARPELTAAEADKLAQGDNPSDPLQQRIQHLAAQARVLLVPRTQRQARPWGTNRPDRGRAFLAVTLLITAAGFGLSLRRIRYGPTVAAPVPATAGELPAPLPLAAPPQEAQPSADPLKVEPVEPIEPVPTAPPAEPSKPVEPVS